MSIFFVQYCHPSARILDRFEKPEPCIFTYPPHPVSFASGSVTRPCLLALISSLRKIPARPSRPFLGHMDPSFPIEKHFVLPRMLYAGCQHILSSIASHYHAQELTRRAKKWLAKCSITRRFHPPGRDRTTYSIPHRFALQ